MDGLNHSYELLILEKYHFRSVITFNYYPVNAFVVIHAIKPAIVRNI